MEARTQQLDATVAVREAGVTERQALFDIIMLAFAQDPAMRWVFSDAHAYASSIHRFTDAFGGAAFEHGTAHVLEEGARYRGAALWLPPGVGPDEEALVGLLQDAVPDELHGEAFAVLEQMGSYHPEEPHWYLPMIGVDPAHQGRQFGSALLAHALATCDRDQVPAYLESSNPRNVPLYERHGFRVMGTIQAGNSPAIIPMRRDPQ